MDQETGGAPAAPHGPHPEPTADAVEAWLTELPDLERARLLAVLTDTKTVGRLTRLRQKTVYTITRRMTDIEAAEALKVSPSAVRNAVSAYCKTHPDAPRKLTRVPKASRAE